MIEHMPLKTIGRAELVSFPTLDIEKLPAKVDTGAETSSIWASFALIEKRRLAVKFMGEGHSAYTGKICYFSDFTQTVVATSTGHTETRYKVKIPVRIGGKRIRARFTLADRRTQVYPVLIGRNVLRGKFIVDVRRGRPLLVEERRRSQRLQSRLK